MTGMIHVEPFRSGHLAQIAVQPAQAAEWPDCAERAARGAVFERASHGNSFLDDEGRVIACFGMIETHPQYLTAWAVLAVLSAGQLGFATRWCRAYLAALEVRRIDMCVRDGFAQAQRWAAMLGFGHEGVQHGFYPDGTDLHIWAMLDGRPFQAGGIDGVAVNQDRSAAWPSCR